MGDTYWAHIFFLLKGRLVGNSTAVVVTTNGLNSRPAARTHINGVYYIYWYRFGI